MGCQLAVQTGIQALKGVRIIFLNGKLSRQTAAHSLIQLADGIVQKFKSIRNSLLLVCAWDGAQANAKAMPQFGRFFGTVDYSDVHTFVEAQRYQKHNKHHRRRNDPKGAEGFIPREISFPANRWVAERTLG